MGEGSRTINVSVSANNTNKLELSTLRFSVRSTSKTMIEALLYLCVSYLQLSPAEAVSQILCLDFNHQQAIYYELFFVRQIISTLSLEQNKLTDPIRQRLNSKQENTWHKDTNDRIKISTDLFLFANCGQHHYRKGFVFPDHTPKIYHSVVQRGLGGNECFTLLKTLQKERAHDNWAMTWKGKPTLRLRWRLHI